jgi:hypothetical protein
VGIIPDGNRRDARGDIVEAKHESMAEQVWPEALVFIALVALMVAEVRDSASLIPQLLKQSRSVIACHDACRCAATIQ